MWDVDDVDDDLLPVVLVPRPMPLPPRPTLPPLRERETYAAEEAARYRRVGKGVWRRHGRVGLGSSASVRLRVGKSPIHGKGLFAACELEAGDRIGRFWGTVVHRSDDAGECERMGKAFDLDRLVLLRDGTGWCVVDMTGCVFEWSNCCAGEEEPPMRVTEAGWVETTRDVEPGEELTWDYDRTSFRL